MNEWDYLYVQSRMAGITPIFDVSPTLFTEQEECFLLFPSKKNLFLLEIKCITLIFLNMFFILRRIYRIFKETKTLSLITGVNWLHEGASLKLYIHVRMWTFAIPNGTSPCSRLGLPKGPERSM